MKFTWKMIGLVAILLAVSLSIGGYSVIRGAFRSKLSSELQDAQEDMRMFSLTMQAICSDALRSGDEDRAMRTLKTLLVEDADQRSFRVCNEGGEVLVGNMQITTDTSFDAPVGVIETSVLSVGERKFVLSAQKLTIYGSVFYLERSREVTDIYTQTDEELSNYYLIMLLILFVGIGLTSAMTFYLTRPIRRISRAAKQFSDGRYEKRAVVHSKDELGQLAQTFNEMADSLESKIHELADAAQRQKDFTASFAHELKTPLTSVIGYADTLRSRVLPADMQLEAVNYIFYEGKRLEAMSFALLDLFALERETPQFRNISSGRLLRDTEKSCAYILKDKNIRLEMQIEEAVLYVVPELIRTLLYNLIDNARKASEEGSAIEVLAEQTQNGFRFCVRDHGRGIPPEALERLTEPFYMVDKSRSRAQGGAGLGLALCKRIAELHKASLVFESALGEGTCVSFTVGGEPF